MTSFGVAPALFGSESPVGPRSSILLNPHERPVIIQVPEKKSWQGSRGRSPAVRVQPPPPPIVTNVVPPSPNPATGNSDNGDKSPRIRFAPLPDPHRPRSESTGHSVHHRLSEGPNGEREYTLELRSMTMDDEECDENVVDDNEMSSGEESDGSEDYDWERDGRRKSWAVSMGSMSNSMGMGSAWSGTKKLVGLKDTPSKKNKSLSPGGFGTSPSNSTFLSTGRRGSTASTGSNHSSSGHRRTGSSGAGSLPPTAKMLNGRVYGARRASEAAALEKLRREQNEPAFVEWGGGGMGSSTKKGGDNISRSVGSKSAFDDDDGGGMSWVRKRREERERKAREEREATLAAAAAAKDGDAAATGDTVGPTDAPTQGTPENPGMSLNHRPESVSSASSTASHREDAGNNGPLTPNEPHNELTSAFANFGGFGATAERQKSVDLAPDAKGPAAGHDSGEHLHTIKIPHSRFRRRSDDNDEEEVESDGDGDFDNDDDEEVELGRQKCAAAAGVEVLSRHF